MGAVGGGWGRLGAVGGGWGRLGAVGGGWGRLGAVEGGWGRLRAVGGGWGWLGAVGGDCIVSQLNPNLVALGTGKEMVVLVWESNYVGVGVILYII